MFYSNIVHIEASESEGREGQGQCNIFRSSPWNLSSGQFTGFFMVLTFYRIFKWDTNLIKCLVQAENPVKSSVTWSRRVNCRGKGVQTWYSEPLERSVDPLLESTSRGTYRPRNTRSATVTSDEILTFLIWHLITRRNEVLAKVIFLHLFVILFTGGVWQGEPPPPAWTTPLGMENPPGPDTTPQAWRTPRHGEPPLPPGHGEPPRAWRNPPGMENPPRTRHHPPRHGEPPPEADSGIRSTIGRYASYWNAFLFIKNLFFELSLF